MIVNQKQLAECLGISSRRVRQLREEGLFKLTQEGKGYNLEKSIQEYIEYKVNAETGRPGILYRKRRCRQSMRKSRSRSLF